MPDGAFPAQVGRRRYGRDGDSGCLESSARIRTSSRALSSSTVPIDRGAGTPRSSHGYSMLIFLNAIAESTRDDDPNVARRTGEGKLEAFHAPCGAWHACQSMDSWPTGSEGANFRAGSFAQQRLVPVNRKDCWIVPLRADIEKKPNSIMS